MWGETAKSLLVCKAVSSTIFEDMTVLEYTLYISSKMVLEEPQEVVGNCHPRYMTIRVFTLDRIRLTT